MFPLTCFGLIGRIAARLQAVLRQRHLALFSHPLLSAGPRFALEGRAVLPQVSEPYTNYMFTEEFNVQRLEKSTIDPANKVCITPIQRLYSMLKGEEEFEEENEEGSMFETEQTLVKEPMPVIYNPKIPLLPEAAASVDHQCGKDKRNADQTWRPG